MTAVVAKDDELDSVAFDQVEKFLCAGAELLLVVVVGPRFAIDAEGALNHDGVDGEQDRAGLRKLEENGLMAGSVAVGCEESDAWGEFRIAVDEAITERGMIPMRASRRKTPVPAASQRVMFTLDD